MEKYSRIFSVLGELIRLARTFLADGMHFVVLCTRSRTAMAAENLFLRKQLAFYQERKVIPRRFDNVTRFILVLLSRGFAWKNALVNVTPKTFIGWHRAGFRLFWRWKSRPGRPRIPPELRALIREMARDNPGWGEERIANELLLKLGIQVSPRTVRKYMPKRPPGQPRGDQRWSTFVANHAQAIVACDFLTVVTATFKCLHVFVIFLIHDRDCIFSSQLDQSITRMGLRVLKTPYRSPKANSFCERVIGTLRRECLDFLIPLTEKHLRTVLKNWQTHYNQARPHSSIGPGIPDPPANLPVPLQEHRHRIPGHLKVVNHPVLGGLHHEYERVPKAA